MRLHYRVEQWVRNKVWKFTTPCPIPAACMVFQKPSFYLLRTSKMSFSAVDIQRVDSADFECDLIQG